MFVLRNDWFNNYKNPTYEQPIYEMAYSYVFIAARIL